jgi:dTDP-4-amino-4,6-dideoxygalactose transaminase
MSIPLIPHSRPCFGPEEAAAAADAVRSGWVKGGPRRDELERCIGEDQGFAHVLATTSCTQALHLALRARFPDGGMRVAFPSYVCRSVWDAVLLAGGAPVLVDCDPVHFGPVLAQVEAARPDAVIVPQLFGTRAPVEPFLGRGWFVIEDAAQRLQPGERGPVAPELARTFSFEATKVITCGEGGAVAFHDPALAVRAVFLRDGGYQSPETALWLPFSDLQAAVALVQWARLAGMTGRRRLHVDRLLEVVPASAVHPCLHAPGQTRFRLLLRARDPAAFIAAAAARGVAVRRPVAPMPLHRLFEAPGDFAGAQAQFDHNVSVPCHASLTADELDRVAACLASLTEFLA